MNKYLEIQQSPHRVWRRIIIIIIIIIFVVRDIVVPRFFTISPFRSFHKSTNRNARGKCKYVFIRVKFSRYNDTLWVLPSADIVSVRRFCITWRTFQTATRFYFQLYYLIWFCLYLLFRENLRLYFVWDLSIQ